MKNEIVQFTSEALNELNRLKLQQHEDEKKYLRIGVKGGGCSGMSYLLEFDQLQNGDEIIEVGGIDCCIDKTHKLYLQGMTIHWENGLQNRGFSFQNPNATKTCGCGTSFAV